MRPEDLMTPDLLSESPTSEYLSSGVVVFVILMLFFLVALSQTSSV